MIQNHEVTINTKGNIDVIDITNNIKAILDESTIKNGILTIFIVGSTAGVTTIEYEPGLIKDIKDFYNNLIPHNLNYAHHNTWGDDNGSSHLQSALLKTSFVVPIINGELSLGIWQQIVIIDFDTKPRQRKIVCQFMGE